MLIELNKSSSSIISLGFYVLCAIMVYCLYKVSTSIIKVKQHHDQDPSLFRTGQRQGQDRPNPKCETSHPILNLWGGMVQGKESKFDSHLWSGNFDRGRGRAWSSDAMIYDSLPLGLWRLKWSICMWESIKRCSCLFDAPCTNYRLLLVGRLWLRIFSYTYTQATRVTLSIGGTLAANYSGESGDRHTNQG